jgi:glycerophosphoryl diester phosphodiesterase
MSKQKIISRLNPLFFEGIAHRGLWNDRLTENGLKAFTAAKEQGYAFELDIHLTKDGELLVCHDEELKRTTGQAGIIEELTMADIKKNYRLLDGEEVPSFAEVLAMDQETVPIVVELKVYKGNYKPLAKKAKEVLKKSIADPRNIWMISFDPRALLQMGHRYERSLLVCQDYIGTLKYRHFFESLDMQDCLVDDKRVLRFAKRHPINVWTIQEAEQAKKVAPYVDTMTFQHLDPAFVRSLLKKAN